MKKCLPLFLLFAVSSALTAQKTIWTEDFVSGINMYIANTNFGVLYASEKPANTPEMVAAGTDEWSGVIGSGGTPTNVASTGKGGIFLEQKSEASRGVSFVLDSSFFTEGAGKYTLNFEIWAIYKPTTLVVAIYGAQSTPGNDYFVDLASPAGESLLVLPAEASSAPVGLLAVPKTYKRSDNGGDIPAPPNLQWNPRSIDFNYSGTGDVVLHFYGRVDATGWDGFTIGGDMSITTEMGAADPVWAGFPIRQDGYVDTGSFLGWIWVGDPAAPSDWVWSVSLAGYVYLPQAIVAQGVGGWVYIPNFAGAPGGSTEPLWAGYPIRPDGYVDTGSFLGWIYVGDPAAHSDWVWSISFSKFVYLPENLVNPQSGAWAYFLW